MRKAELPHVERRDHHRARLSAAGLAAVLTLGTASYPADTSAADPRQAAIEQVAVEHGVAPSDLEVVNERQATSGGETLSAVKLFDRHSGEIHSVYRDVRGVIGDGTVLQAVTDRGAVDLTVLERKADEPLLAAVAELPTEGTLRVAIWTDVDTGIAAEAVRAVHPEVTWLAGRPVTDDLAQLRSLRGELWEARRVVLMAAADRLRTRVEAQGGTVAYASTSSPLVFADMPATGVEALASLPEVTSMGLEGTWETQMSSAGRAVGANWTSGSGDQGNGVRVGVVEYQNVRNTGDMAGQVARSYSTTGSLSYGSGGGDHPTWVAGAVASRSGTYAGVAPGADIVSASTGGYRPSLATDRAIIAAADWAISPSGGDADILNASIGQDTATGAEEARRYFDSIAWEDGRLVVAASGNYVTFGNWDVVSPGTGYNVLTVGGINDRGTAGTSDDRLWYVPGSNGAAYRDRTDASWNVHGDYNKPNVSAPSVSVRTANGIIGDGTSVASPIVAGVAAQLVARAPALAAWPEATRALVMAGAFRRSPMPNGGVDTDHEGVGTVSATWSNRALVNGNGTYGGYVFGAMTRGQTVVREIPVVAGQRVRAALAWSSHTSGSNTTKADALMADLDLRIIAPNGAVTGSYSWDNPYEVAEITAATTGTLRIEIRHDRFDAAEEPYGLAWTVRGPFFDADDSPFRADILWAAREEITAGCATNRYCPGAAVTREQMASFLRRAGNVPSSSIDRFTDDDASMHEADINAIAAVGITGGCATSRYCPRSPVTREQMASFLVRALDLPAGSRDYFTDDEGSQHEAAINALAAAGITGGCATGRYCPGATVTRGQMAAFLHRGFGP
ncbi:MAG: S8 family peptidase [Chloroflexota bacterium]